MSSDEPFDFDAPDQPRAPRPRPTPPPRVSSSSAPGRRPGRPTSRARTGGAAQPLPADQAPRRSSRTTGRAAGTPARGARGDRPPSFAPGGASPDEAPQRTRAMPAASTPPRSVSARSSGGRGGPARPPDAPPARPARTGTGTAPKPRRRRRGRVVAAVIALLLVLVLAWPVGLLIWANGKMNHVDAVSGGLSTPGTTYLLAGTDSRADGVLQGDDTEGSRTDTIMLLTVPRSGRTSLISLPRDTYVDIPGHGPNKLNASFVFGGPPLLVETVEALTGIGVDHYVEIGMGGVAGLVDAVGGVELCLDYVVDDKDSGLVWDEPGCQLADGATALAFARMRKADPLGDIGRTQRQQQVIQAVTGAVADPSIVTKPGEQVRLAEAGLGALTFGNGTNILDLGRLALAFRDATGSGGVRGTPPIANLDYRPGGVGSTVLLDEALAPAFFESVVDGTITPEDADPNG